MIKHKLVPFVALTKEDAKIEEMNGAITRLLKNNSIQPEVKMAFYEDMLAQIQAFKENPVRKPPPVVMTMTEPPKKKSSRIPQKAQKRDRESTPPDPPPLPPSPKKRAVTRTLSIEKHPAITQPPAMKIWQRPVVKPHTKSPPKPIKPVPARSPYMFRRVPTRPQAGNGIIRKKKWKLVY